jgi:hypothetical protein
MVSLETESEAENKLRSKFRLTKKETDRDADCDELELEIVAFCRNNISLALRSEDSIFGAFCGEYGKI